jgi:hypothetical protein
LWQETGSAAVENYVATGIGGAGRRVKIYTLRSAFEDAPEKAGDPGLSISRLVSSLRHSLGPNRG